MSGKVQHPMSEALLNDYADEAKERGRLSSGKVSNLLGEVWHWRALAQKHEAEASRLRQEVRSLRSEVEQRAARHADRGSGGLPW